MTNVFNYNQYYSEAYPCYLPKETKSYGSPVRSTKVSEYSYYTFYDNYYQSPTQTKAPIKQPKQAYAVNADTSRRYVHKPIKTNSPLNIPDQTKNISLKWETPNYDLRQNFRFLGVQLAEPSDYINDPNIVPNEYLPPVHKNLIPPGQKLAVEASPKTPPILVGDIQALKLINLDAYGLSEYKSLLRYI